MVRLPNPGSDENTWGQILNDYLSQVHDGTGQLKPGVVAKTALEAGVQTSLGKADTALQSAPVTSVASKTGAVTLVGTDVQGVIIENINAVASSGGSQTLPAVGSATMNTIVLTAACTLTFPTATAGTSFSLLLIQDGTGNRTVTWPSNIKWPGGVVPSLSVAANAADTFSFFCPTGITWYGYITGQDMR